MKTKFPNCKRSTNENNHPDNSSGCASASFNLLLQSLSFLLLQLFKRSTLEQSALPLGTYLLGESSSNGHFHNTLRSSEGTFLPHFPSKNLIIQLNNTPTAHTNASPSSQTATPAQTAMQHSGVLFAKTITARKVPSPF